MLIGCLAEVQYIQIAVRAEFQVHRPLQSFASPFAKLAGRAPFRIEDKIGHLALAVTAIQINANDPVSRQRRRNGPAGGRKRGPVSPQRDQSLPLKWRMDGAVPRNPILPAPDCQGNVARSKSLSGGDSLLDS